MAAPNGGLVSTIEHDSILPIMVPDIHTKEILSYGRIVGSHQTIIHKTSKYPIANHVCTEKLTEPLKAFVHQLSAIHIPIKVAKVVKDPKWV
ncbi:unnamed protein product [Prunus armeniaca]